MKNSYLMLICFLFLMGHCAWGESITKSVHFSYSELKIEELTEDGHVYSRLILEDWENDGNIGYPMIPIKYETINIPFSADNISVNVKKHNIKSLYLDYPIIPNQEDDPTGFVQYKKTFIPGDSNIYLSCLPYPNKSGQIVSTPSIGKEHRYVKIGLYPITYYPMLNRLELAEDFDIIVNYTVPTVKASMSRITPGNYRSGNDIGIPFYKYCVITNNSLKDSFTRLIAWRKQKGQDAGIVCVEDILNNPYIIGDTVSSIYDNAGKLRQYLQYAYASGITQYVLFGGNDQILPIRYGTGNGYNWPNEITNEYLIPSDFYYSELNSNWNRNNDQYWGEYSDNLNYGGQLYVGRILCTTIAEVENYTNKLLRYELYPGNGDFSYLNRAFFQQADDMQISPTGGQANYIATALGGNFTTKRIIQEIPDARSSNTTSPYGKDVIDSMKVHYGYVSWFGHGHPNGITTKSNSIYQNNKWIHLSQPYGITSVEDSVPYMMNENGNSLSSLGNKTYPMIAYSIACTITPFDTFEEYTEFPNLGQSFTLGKDYGGPALIGNTRYGWVSYSYKYQQHFNNYAINETLGKSLVLARASYCSSSRYPHFLAHSSNLIGCPFIRLWTDVPTLFNATLSYNSDNYVIAANSSIMDAEIGIRDITQPNETVNSVSFNPSQGSKTLTNVENSLITLTGKNCLPQIMPLTIQNTTLQGTHHIIVKDVACGKDVRDGIQGNVIFDEGSNYTFETKGTFVLGKGVTIKKGAELNVIRSTIKY